jgi:hypothetical protein
MSEREEKTPLIEFIKKRRKPTSLEIQTPKVGVAPAHIPWYRRPLSRTEFMFKLAKNGRYYVRHKEWSRGIWIGPYRNTVDVESVIGSYLEESLKGGLDKVVNSQIHSVVIEDENDFF